MKLRPYQVEAKNAVLQKWGEGSQKTLLVLPTGCGKTIVFASIIQERINQGGRALVLAHREELLQQASDKIKTVTGMETALEKGSSTAWDSVLPITVGSIQSLCRANRLERYPRDYFTDIIVDEAHHCLSDTYQNVLSYFDSANILGVTATPDRGDKKNLAEFFDSLAYEYSLRKAVVQGYLARVVAKMIPLEIDLKKVSVSCGDYVASDIGHALEPYLEQIAEVMARECVGRKTVVFLPLVSTSRKFCRLLQQKGMKAAEVNGESENRAEVLENFENGAYDVLCNSMLLTEGWDCPSVDCVVVLRPTKSRALYCQMVGRGMRLSPNKENLLLLDFLWMTEKHSLCRPSALVSKSAEIAHKVDSKTLDVECDILEAEDQAERDIIKEREDAIAEELQRQRRRKARTVDPIQYAFSIADEDLVNYEPVLEWERAEPTQKQKELLEKWGIDSFSVKSKGKASLILDRLQFRCQNGLTTPKQIRLLERYGFREVGTWQFNEAKRLIGMIAANGWKIRYDLINPATYKPQQGVING